MAATKTIEECVRLHAINDADKIAVICDEDKLTYAQLWEAVSKRSGELEREGLCNGSLNIFRALQNYNFIVEYLATHLAGAVAVPLEKDCPEEKYQKLIEYYGKVKLPVADSPSEAVADILFTTGSTGEQKGVMESYRVIWADADNLIHAQGFSKDTVFIICGPLNHIGSLSKIWPTLILGGTLIILQGMKDNDAFFRAFDYPSDNLATFMVPASINIVLQFGADRIKRVAHKIDFIETGGAAITQADMDALCKLLPNTRLYNTYASTETGIVCTYDYNNNPCVAGCTGKAMRNSYVYITPEGTIACEGATLMSGYITPQLSTAYHQLSTFTTCDLGEIDDDGNLHIKGRNNDVINIGGYKVSPLEIENVASAFPQIAECLCFRINSPLFGETIKLIYTSKDTSVINKKSLALFLAKKLERYKIPRVFEQVTAIKHLYNGKLDRKYYSDYR